MSCLWMSIEPQATETRLELSEGGRGLVLRARLPQLPQQERALATLLEALSAWYGRSLTAVLDADAQDVAQHPERWARLLGDLDGGRISVQWVSVPRLGSPTRRCCPGPAGPTEAFDEERAVDPLDEAGGACDRS